MLIDRLTVTVRGNCPDSQLDRLTEILRDKIEEAANAVSRDIKAELGISVAVEVED